MLLISGMSDNVAPPWREATMLKTLIGVACVVVIAAGSFYLYGQISLLYDHAKAARTERVAQAERDKCIGNLQQFYGDRVNTDLAGKVDNCVAFGYLTQNEVYVKLHPKFD
jgi:hypothetical protein